PLTSSYEKYFPPDVHISSWQLLPFPQCPAHYLCLKACLSAGRRPGSKDGSSPFLRYTGIRRLSAHESYDCSRKEGRSSFSSERSCICRKPEWRLHEIEYPDFSP